MNQNDYIEAGLRVFGLHSVDDNGCCTCGDPECKALFKHPIAAGWQNTPDWSDEQLETMEAMGQFKTGFGVLVGDHLIIDIDPRNGGKLEPWREYYEQSGFVVATGGGGWHIYFKRPHDAALVSHLKEFEGVDFKSSGYVVGCGSLHASGAFYEAEKGHPCDITDAPQKLLDMLKKPDKTRSEYKGGHIDLGDSELSEMLKHVDPSCDYDQWIRIGMAIHDATSGAGFELWDAWSQGGDTYPDSDQLAKHWHSFGKSANLATVGTLIYYAEQGGWVQSVEFESEPPEPVHNDDDNIDLLRPPSFAGELVAWINSQCRFPRERMAVAAALSALGNVAGLNYQDTDYDVTANQFMFCVSGSATGKEAILQAQADIHRAAGLQAATHGAIKSEQEIIRNLVDHQASFYIVDEMGIVLQKIKNARERGGAAYLEGVIGALMSIYSKANSYQLVSGDLKKDVKKQLFAELKALEKRADNGDGVEDLILSMQEQIKSLDNGLERPFLSLIGFTTPVTFNNLIDYESSANGFFGRALIAYEKDTNPRAKKGFRKQPMPDHIKNKLLALASSGAVSKSGRIENRHERTAIPTEPAALALLSDIEDEFHAMAEEAKGMTLEAVPRRGFELVLKVSLVLAMAEGVRTSEHVKWARAYVIHDIKQKMNLAASNIADTENRKDEATSRKILAMLDKDKGETLGVIANRCRPIKKDDVEKLLNLLENNNLIKKEAHEYGKGKKTYKYFLG